MTSSPWLVSPHVTVRVGRDALVGADAGAGGSFWSENPGLATAYSLASVAGVGLGAYHGYKRDNSVGWAIAWGLLGGLFPFITIPVSLAQGFAKPARG